MPRTRESSTGVVADNDIDSQLANVFGDDPAEYGDVTEYAIAVKPLEELIGVPFLARFRLLASTIGEGEFAVIEGVTADGPFIAVTGQQGIIGTLQQMDRQNFRKIRAPHGLASKPATGKGPNGEPIAYVAFRFAV